jgi:hypothetical protein
MKKDNSTFSHKRKLRKMALGFIDVPVVMETHGGWGKIWEACYFGIRDGVVFEKDGDKASALAEQRPEWLVYQCDCIDAIRARAGSTLGINFIDIDPYGDPWPTIDSLLTSGRSFPSRMVIVVNDGLKLNLKIGGGNSPSVQESVIMYGDDYLSNNYLEICREMMIKKAGQIGYSLSHWGGYYCGHNNQMTHYAAVLDVS